MFAGFTVKVSPSQNVPFLVKTSPFKKTKSKNVPPSEIYRCTILGNSYLKFYVDLLYQLIVQSGVNLTKNGG